ncbi:hypothetical protein M407DRAFT_11850 [Tulasnella calospora MUT 4182]|uniref:DNA mismatch repair protein MSH3 n=1 Tax=Tulasnella calospora MUT 4182 TaxID=1051891 RepID=A0A0C3Q5T2_9AGAM|nr:hypothetical protein M407DRAFT_11850 [Tulasnella calospora MUT 4182]
MAPSGSKATQPTLSAYFTNGPGAKQRGPSRKRAATPIDLTTLDESESDGGNGNKDEPTARAAKRPRLATPNEDEDDDIQSVIATGGGTVSRFFAPKTPVKTKPTPKSEVLFTPRPIGASPVSKYVYRPSPVKTPLVTQRPDDDAGGEDEEMLTESDRRAIEARKDAFRRKLGGDGGHFDRTDSHGLQIPEDPLAYDEEGEGARGAPSRQSEQEDDEDEEEEIVEVPAISERLKKFAAQASSSAGSSRSSSSAKDPVKKAAIVKGRTKKVKEVGPEGKEYTPLELQVKACKERHPDCLLLFEVGYKYRFFGTDAQIASKELGIACWMDRNFKTASIPVHRKTVHIKKLIAQGHKVGIIGQTETAALKKVGDNRSGPFERQLTELYTATTYIDELDSADDESRASPPTLTCFVESLLGGMGADQRVLIGMVSVIPSTGEVTYDEWEDGHMRTELETRITHIRPAELLIPGNKKLSKSTAKMLEYFTGNRRFNAGRNIRVEQFSEQMSHTDAFGFVKKFYTSGERSSQRGDVMATIVDFPKQVIIALAHAIEYLTNFKVADAFLEATFFSTFASRTHMHPMAEAVRPDPFVPNSVAMGEGEPRTKIITVETLLNRISQVTVMAQVGSYVPAARATLSLHDCILTRMGAADDLARGHSTFMVELQETSDIMRQATSRSLIILDELGRGTSTHDGQAIASAVLEYLQTIKRPKILFITHYPLLAAEFAEEFEDVANLHMAHGLGAKRPDGTSAVNFLYRLAPGMASGSYGIECGRVAGLPPNVLAAAQQRSDSMKADIERAAGSRKWKALLEAAFKTDLSTSDRGAVIRRLRTTML